MKLMLAQYSNIFFKNLGREWDERTRVLNLWFDIHITWFLFLVCRQYLIADRKSVSWHTQRFCRIWCNRQPHHLERLFVSGDLWLLQKLFSSPREGKTVVNVLLSDWGILSKSAYLKYLILSPLPFLLYLTTFILIFYQIILWYQYV